GRVRARARAPPGRARPRPRAARHVSLRRQAAAPLSPVAPLAALLALLALAALAAGCATNPVTGKKEIALVSESQELDAGKQSLAATEAEYGDYDDTLWAARVDSLGRSLAAVSHRPTLAWQFHVLDDPAVNAFAAPGGYIFVTRGILAD